LVGSNSVAPWKTLQSHHPSGISSERTISPEYREIGLAGFEPTTSDEGKEKPTSNKGDGASVES